VATKKVSSPRRTDAEELHFKDEAHSAKAVVAAIAQKAIEPV
jgi:hypothetical protein